MCLLAPLRLIHAPSMRLMGLLEDIVPEEEELDDVHYQVGGWSR